MIEPTLNNLSEQHHNLSEQHRCQMTSDPARAEQATSRQIHQPLCLAYYLPQFHPIPENDAWWGTGFTEWRNVASARPLFRGHYQPHIPADLGYYDLRLAEVRAKQAELASSAGLDGFIYWHYWFHGRRLLHRPIDEVLASRSPDFPFCFAWANQDWTRRWIGEDERIVMRQEYSAEDDLAHFRFLTPALLDERYIKIDGRPVLFVYRPSSLPQPRATTETWRAEADRAGFPGLYLIALTSSPTRGKDPRNIGFDASMLHEPCWWNMPGSPMRFKVTRKLNIVRRGYPVVVTYRSFAQRARQRAVLSEGLEYPRWPSVAVGFDNTPRYGHHGLGTVIHDVGVEDFAAWLSDALALSRRICLRFPEQSRPMVTVNAWNEWAEGMHLEPDLRHGDSFLRAMHEVLSRQPVALSSEFEGELA